MTADALRGRRLVAMALLKPGWERDYYARPKIEPVVCVGRILTHEKLADGKYNMLLQGIGRATIEREIDDSDSLYRTADLLPLVESNVMEIDLSEQRTKLQGIFDTRLRNAGGLAKQFRQMLSSPLPTADIADLIAFNVLENVPLKQSLLAETDVIKRVNRVILELESMEPMKSPVSVLPGMDDPSMN